MGGRPTVVVGRVGKPFGVRGEVHVQPDPDLGDLLVPGRRYQTDRGPDLLVAACHVHGDRLLVAFEGVDDRTAAEALRGTLLVLPRDAVELPPDTIWADDLLGRDVVDARGGLVGTVAALADGPAHDYLVLARPDGGELLIPLVPDLVDTDADPLVLADVDGLADPDTSW